MNRHLVTHTLAQETELKLLLRPETLPALLDHPLLGGRRPRPQRLCNTYVDTPALALMAERVAVRERRVGRQTLLTVKTAGTSAGGLSARGEWEAPTQPGAPDFRALLGDHPVAGRLAALSGRLVPVFRTDFARRRWHLAYGGARIELALDQGVIRTGQGRQARSEPLLELELELQDGPVDALYGLALALAWPPADGSRPGLWLVPSDLSKAQRGLALLQGHTVRAQRPAVPVLAASAAPLAAFQAIAWACLAPLQANLTRLALDTRALADPEFVHQSRVALRRLRTALKLFAPWLPARFVRTWRPYWQAAARRLGEVRDWDVFDAETLPRLVPDAAQAAWVRGQREAAWRQLHAALAEPAMGLALLAFARDLARLQPRKKTKSKRALAPWARRLLRETHRRLRRRARRALKAGPQERHTLRLALKQERYALECLASLLPADEAANATRKLAHAQEVLGRLNDLDTARARLASAPDALRQALLPRIDALEAQAIGELPAIERSLRRLRLFCR